MKEIPLSQGYVAIVDDEDYERASQHKWYAWVRRRADGSEIAYARRQAKVPGGRRATQLLHRLIMDAPDGFYVDHIDGDGLDNRRLNLRVCTAAENTRNQRAGSGGSSKFKGVHWSKRDKKWYARVWAKGKKKCLGYFTSEVDAAKAYDCAAAALFGEFARLNFKEAIK